MGETVPELFITDKVRDSLKEVQSVQKIDPVLRQKCQQFLESGTGVPVKVIRDLYKELKASGQKIFLHEIVEGADLILQPKELPPRDPGLEARVQKLRIEEENKEYRRMTQNVDPMKGTQRFTLQQEVKSMNRQLTSVVNFLITVAAGFAFGYKVVECSFGRIFPLQMMAGLIVGTVIFFVDLYFMVKYAPI